MIKAAIQRSFKWVGTISGLDWTGLDLALNPGAEFEAIDWTRTEFHKMPFSA